jgi:phosphate transport system substrate-binding protein
VLQELTEEFHRQHPNVLFDLRGGGSTLAEEQVMSGRIDLAATTLHEPNVQGVEPRSIGQPSELVRIPIGIDGLAIIVHANNSVSSLTMAELRGLFSARVFNWEEVGGDQEEVILISREDGSGARYLFEKHVMHESPVSLTAVVMPTSSDVLEYTAKHPAAIGYVSRAYVTRQLGGLGDGQDSESLPEARSHEVNKLRSIRVVSLDGMLPTYEGLKAREYPLIQPLYLISRGEPQDWVRQFVDFVLSPAGQSIVARHHLPVR